MNNVKEKKKTGFHCALMKDSARGYEPYLFGAALCVVLASVFSYLIPLCISFTVDTLLLGEESRLPFFLAELVESNSREFYLERLWIPAVALMAFTALNGAFTFLRQYLCAEAAEGIAKKMRDMLYSHIQRLPFDWCKHASAGDIVQRCSSDVDTVRRFISVQLLEIVRTVSMVAIALAIMLDINVKMSVAAVAVLPLLLVVSAVFFKKITKYFRSSDEAEGRIMTVLQENMSGVRVVRAFGRQRSELVKFEKSNIEYRDITYKLGKIQGLFWGISDTIGYLQIAVTLLVGILLSARGELSLGSVMVFYMYSGMMTWPVRQLGRVLSEYSKSVVSLGRLDEVMSVDEEAETGLSLTPDIKGKIEFRDVHFSYEDNTEVLSGVSFTVMPGKTVAILGSTGSGKTSLVQLLQRLYRADSGKVLLDGINVNDIERAHLRKSIGIVLQEPFLFARSIKENIRIARPDATDEEVFESARAAAVHGVISSFEKGYDTVVGERGVTLSGGQRQRVAIARMLIGRSPILIFDDSMSAVDAETDYAIRKALAKRRVGTTTLLISHRVTTLREADEIIVLDKGRVAESGSHEELMQKNGIYRRIADIQSMSADFLAGIKKDE